MQANKTPLETFPEALDKWVDRRAKERETLATDEEKLASVEADNATLREIRLGLEQLLAEVETPTTNNH